LLPAAAQSQNDKRIDDLRKAVKILTPLGIPLGTPKPYEWLATNDEPGQTFEEYLKCQPTLPVGDRKKIYIQPIGTFTANQQKLSRSQEIFSKKHII